MKGSIQDNSGLKKLLTMSQVYAFFQKLLGARSANEWLTTNVWKLKGGETIVDIGCGSGTILEYLPHDIEYLGVDISENYINAARKRFSARGTFFLGTARDLINHDGIRLKKADLVLCTGLLHHLSDDEAIEVLEVSKSILKTGGRLVCVEPTFLARQTRLSKWIVSADRGRYVRSEQEWKPLISRVFDSYFTSILTGLIRIPYTHIIIECVNDLPSGLKEGKP